MKIQAAARKLKCTMILDPAPFVALRIPDGASRVELAISVEGRTVSADLSAKSLRKALATLRESGAGNVVLLVQGVLTAAGKIEECGLVAQVKTPKDAAPSPPRSTLSDLRAAAQIRKVGATS
jgi:hypothetical protein